MLVLSRFIGKGATRLCFAHPYDKSKCVKVIVRPKEAGLLQKELEAYFAVKSFLGEYLVLYDANLVKTNYGVGLVCELLKDDDGSISKPLSFYMRKDKLLNRELISQFWHFFYCLLENDLFFYDFNLQNFMVQNKEGRLMLKYTDLKSYCRYKPWIFLRLEKIFPFLARRLMCHRLKKMFFLIGLLPPK